MKNSRIALKHPKVENLERRLFLKQSTQTGFSRCGTSTVFRLRCRP